MRLLLPRFSSPLGQSTRRTFRASLLLAAGFYAAFTPLRAASPARHTAVAPVTNAAAPVIISPTTATAVENASFNYQIILADAQSGTYAAAGLPPGLTLDPKVGAVSGSTSTLGVFAVQLTATNANGTATATLTLTVEPAAPPVFSSATTASGQQGTAFSFQVVAAEGVENYSAAFLPPGLTIDPATGLISGTPNSVGFYNTALQATNARGTTSALLRFTIIPDVPVVTLTADVPTANPSQGILGSFTLTRTGDLSQPLSVTFTIKGTGQNGVDYKLLTTTKTMKAGKGTKRLKITAYPVDGASAGTKKTVKLTLQPSGAYAIGDSSTAKVKIFYNP